MRVAATRAQVTSAGLQSSKIAVLVGGFQLIDSCRGPFCTGGAARGGATSHDRATAPTGLCDLFADRRRVSGTVWRRVRCGVAAGGSGGLGCGKGVARDDADAGAGLRQRPVAVAASRGGGRGSGARRRGGGGVGVNGVGGWRPAGEADAEAVPADGWGYFKVPGPWPGINDYLQKDSQTVYAHPSWKDQKFAAVTAAWYQREVEIPGAWAGRRIAISLEYLNSFAAVYVDGRKAGEVRFPAGELDLSAFLRPGAKHVLSLRVVAMPLKAVMLSYTDSAHSREVKGT